MGMKRPATPARRGIALPGAKGPPQLAVATRRHAARESPSISGTGARPSLRAARGRALFGLLALGAGSNVTRSLGS